MSVRVILDRYDILISKSEQIFSVFSVFVEKVTLCWVIRGQSSREKLAKYEARRRAAVIINFNVKSHNLVDIINTLTISMETTTPARVSSQPTRSWPGLPGQHFTNHKEEGGEEAPHANHSVL